MDNTAHVIIQIISAVLALGILVLPFYLIGRAFRRAPARVCAACGTEGRGKYVTRGSFLIEIVLWLLLIIPGVIYSLWRMSTRKPVCPACGSEHLVPIDSPVARKIRREVAA